uniref:Uncharacterized protein n=1 Tax=Arundo donax TaxID=35708 RepID=A0A0A9FCC0_ARUDO
MGGRLRVRSSAKRRPQRKRSERGALAAVREGKWRGPDWRRAAWGGEQGSGEIWAPRLSIPPARRADE